jgi:pre-mRNA-splicing factor RBM22/SLT11
MASERGMQVKSFTQGDNRIGAEAAEFPILCETCLGETPYVRMQKIPHGGTCKMCERPFTLFKWRPGRGDGYKMTNVCQTCSKVKNLCQTCILDLQFGLPSQLRDAVLSRADDESIAAPESDANREYHQQQSLVALSSGVGPWQTGETPNDKLLRIARASATNREPARVQIPLKRPARCDQKNILAFF